MKKSLFLILTALLAVAALAGCTQGPAQTTSANTSSTTVATTAPKTPSPAPASDFECTATEDGGIMITRYIGTDTEVVIPESIDGKPVRVIGEKTFDTKTKLTLVHMPDSVTRIEKWAFRNCVS